jgi:hypothetical protein
MNGPWRAFEKGEIDPRTGEIRKRGANWTPPDEEWIRDQHQTQGKSVKEIAKWCRTTPPTVYRWLRMYGIGTGPSDLEPPPQEEWIREQYEIQRKSVKEIAREKRVSMATVKRWMRLYAVPLRGRGKRGPDRGPRRPHQGPRKPRSDRGKTRGPSGERPSLPQGLKQRVEQLKP